MADLQTLVARKSGLLLSSTPFPEFIRGMSASNEGEEK